MAVSKPLRFLVLFFNLLFLIFGVILLGVGIWGEITQKDYAKVDIIKKYEVTSGPRLLIAIAVIIVVVSFFGCFGAYKENKCMLCVFIILLAILLILEIAAAALAYKHKDQIKSKLEDELKKKLIKYVRKNNTDQDIDHVQEKVKCCGITSYENWRLNTHYNSTHSVPDSCCKTNKVGCGKGKLNVPKPSDVIYTEGCYSKVNMANDKILSAVGGVSIAILVVQILGIIFAVVLFCQVRNNEDTKEIK